MPYQQTLTLDGHTMPVSMVSFDSTASKLASCGPDGVKIWDLIHGKELVHEYHPQGRSISAAIWLPRTVHDDLLTVSSEGVLLVWRLKDQVYLPLTTTTYLDHTAVISLDVKRSRKPKDGWRVCSCELDGTVSLWGVDDEGSVELIWRNREHDDSPGRVAFTGEKHVFLYGTKTCTVVLFAEDNFEDIEVKYQLSSTTSNVAFDIRTRSVLVDSADGLEVFPLDQPANNHLLASTHRRPPSISGNIVFVEDGSKVIVGTDTGLVQVFEVGGRLLEEVDVGEPMAMVRVVAAATGNGNALLAVSTANLGRPNLIKIYKVVDTSPSQHLTMLIFALLVFYVVYNELQLRMV